MSKTTPHYTHEDMITHADCIATKGNQLIESLGFDTEDTSIGYDTSTGAFSFVQGDDMSDGLRDFFDWMTNELDPNSKAFKQIQAEYMEYLKRFDAAI